jgi:hypothetical protein
MAPLSLLIAPGDDSKLRLGEPMPFSFDEFESPLIDEGRCSCNNFGAGEDGDGTP